MPHGRNHDQIVRIRGRQFPYLEKRRVGSTTYFLLEQIGSTLRQRFKAFDPKAGPGGSYVLLQDWTDEPGSEQYLKVIWKLKDDGFPRVINYQRTSEGFVCILTWIDGISLEEYLKNIRTSRRPPVDATEAVRLIHGLANSVSRLSGRLGLTHGDIQPANIILTQNTSRLVLIDFGSASSTQALNERTEGDGRHRYYAAPEQWIENSPVRFHADQFSVSAIFYELLTQQIPYEGMGGRAGRPSHIAENNGRLKPPSDLSQSCRNLPRSLRQRLDDVVCKGLALKPEDRFASPRQWVDELFQIQARLRLTPDLSQTDGVLTQVIEWIIRHTIKR